MFGFGVVQGALTYADEVYRALYDQGLAGEEYAGWSWTGINMHVHRDRTPDSDVITLFDQVNETKRRWGDPGETIIGEWGVTDLEEDANPGKLSHIFNLLKPRASAMFLHAHHKILETGDEYWGLHAYSVAGGQYSLGTATILHGPYDELVGP